MQPVLQVLDQPVLMLAVFALIVASLVFHEFGHASACRYGGARPGCIGCGLFLIWPSMYTDVTDVYRINRAGRIRTDLGGVYFNVVFMLGLAGAYLLTGQPFFLGAVYLVHFEILEQLMPAVRLDGYYILGDLAGIPDLYGKIKPILLSMLPGRPVTPEVAGLKRSARVIVTVWVLTMVPLIIGELGYVLWNLPRLLATGLRSADRAGDRNLVRLRRRGDRGRTRRRRRRVHDPVPLGRRGVSHRASDRAARPGNPPRHRGKPPASPGHLRRRTGRGHRARRGMAGRDDAQAAAAAAAHRPHSPARCADAPRGGIAVGLGRGAAGRRPAGLAPPHRPVTGGEPALADARCQSVRRGRHGERFPLGRGRDQDGRPDTQEGDFEPDPEPQAESGAVRSQPLGRYAERLAVGPALDKPLPAAAHRELPRPLHLVNPGDGAGPQSPR